MHPDHFRSNGSHQKIITDLVRFRYRWLHSPIAPVFRVLPVHFICHNPFGYIVWALGLDVGDDALDLIFRIGGSGMMDWLYSLKSATAVASPFLIMVCDDLINSSSHASLLCLCTSSRSGPINFPLPMVWQTEQNVLKFFCILTNWVVGRKHDNSKKQWIRFHKWDGGYCLMKYLHLSWIIKDNFIFYLQTLSFQSVKQ